MAPDVRPPQGSRAILIGVSDYEDATAYPAYPAVANSLRGMHHILTDPDLCGWPPEQVTLIPNPANAGRLLGELRTLAKGTTGALLFYFVGHGVLTHGGELCLAITDTDGANPDVTGLEYAKIKKMLYDGTPAATRIAILDCCYSGRAIGLSAGEQQAQFADLTAAYGAYTLTAADDIASVDVGVGSRAFTAMTGELLNVVRAGIPGGPETISLGQLYPHLRQALHSKGLPQPNQRGDDLAGQFVFTRNVHTGAAPVKPEIIPTRVPETPSLPADGLHLLHTLEGHTESVTALAFSPDGQWLATASDDWTARIWDLATNRELHTLGEQSSPVAAVAFSPDGRRLAIANGSVQIWDLATQRQLHRMAESFGPFGLAFSPDGRWLATATLRRGTVRIWDTVKGRKLRTVGDLNDRELQAMALSPDGRLLAIAGGQFDSVWIWNPETARKLHTVGDTMEILGGMHAMAFSPNGRWLALARKMSGVLLCNPTTGRAVRTVADGLIGQQLLAFSPDSRWLATATAQSGGVRIWEVASGRPVWGPPYLGPERDAWHESFPVYKKLIHARAIAFSPDGERLAAGHIDGTVTIWRWRPPADTKTR